MKEKKVANKLKDFWGKNKKGILLAVGNGLIGTSMFLIGREFGIYEAAGKIGKIIMDMQTENMIEGFDGSGTAVGITEALNLYLENKRK